MRLLVVASFLVAAVCGAPSAGYGQPRPSYGGPIACANGQVLNLDGSCVTPKVHRQVYVFTPPHRPRVHRPRPPLPKPEIITNVVFIRVPEDESVEDIVVPPPQEKTVVYVLNKKNEDYGPRVIEVPAGPPSNPEVYFVHYKDGENPTLPNGIDLQSALANAAHAGGQIIGDYNDGDLHDGLGGLNGGLIHDGGFVQNSGLIHDGGFVQNGGLIHDGGFVQNSGLIHDGGVSGGLVHQQPSGLYGAP